MVIVMWFDGAKGQDRYDHERRFEHHYPRIELPFQLVDTVETGIKKRCDRRMLRQFRGSAGSVQDAFSMKKS